VIQDEESAGKAFLAALDALNQTMADYNAQLEREIARMEELLGILKREEAADERPGIGFP
jgi:hypothetical protein